jgi:iron complex transport system substrate-binding protein
MVAVVRALGVVAATAIGLGLLAGSAEAAPRVMSLDSCADQYVLALAPRETIVGLSHRAGTADSYMRAASAGLPQRRATFESLVAARPDVVVRHWGGDARLVAALDRKGVRTVRIDDAADFDAVRANVRRVAEALDRRAAGEVLVARMDGQLKASAGAWKGQSALYLTPGGYTAGSGTLIDQMLKAAGLSNASTGPFFSAVPLEAMVMTPPRAVVLGFFDLTRAGSDRWGPGRHAALKKVTAERTIASLPGAVVGCPAWFAADGAAMLARAAPR